MECNLLLAVCACVHVRACVCLTTLFFGTQLSSQETATAALLKWGYFTDNQRFAKAPVSGQMKGLTPQGRNCCLFFLQHCSGSPPPSTHLLHPSLFLSGCAHTPRRHLVSHYSLGSFLAECQRRLSAFSHLIIFFSFNFATYSNSICRHWP